MESLSEFSGVVARLFTWTVAAFVALLATKLLAAALRTGGLLSSGSSGRTEPERLVALIATLAAAAGLAVESLGSLGATELRLSEPSDLLVWIAGTGQLSYLVGKAMRFRS